MVFFIFLSFYRQRRSKEYIKRNKTSNSKPKAYRRYTKGAYRLKTKERGIQTTYPPSSIAHPLKKVNKELGPSTIQHLDQDHKLLTKEYFILWIERSSFSKATLFLSLQTIQKWHKGAALQTFTSFLPTSCPYHPRRISFIDEGSTHSTPKRLNNKSHKILALVQ